MPELLGYQPVGGSRDFAPASYIQVDGPWVKTGTEPIANAQLYYTGSSGGRFVLRCVIYQDSGGSPGAFVAVSAEVTINTSQAGGYVRFPFPKSPVLTDGSGYWIGVWFGTGAPGSDLGQGFAYDTFGDYPTHQSLYHSSVVYDTLSDPPDPFPSSPSAINEKLSLYLTAGTFLPQFPLTPVFERFTEADGAVAGWVVPTAGGSGTMKVASNQLAADAIGDGFGDLCYAIPITGTPSPQSPFQAFLTIATMGSAGGGVTRIGFLQSTSSPSSNGIYLRTQANSGNWEVDDQVSGDTAADSVLGVVLDDGDKIGVSFDGTTLWTLVNRAGGGGKWVPMSVTTDILHSPGDQWYLWIEMNQDTDWRLDDVGGGIATVIQTKSRDQGAGSAGTSWGPTFDKPTTAGRTLFAAVSCDSSVPCTGISDGLNTWHKIGSTNSNPDSGDLTLWYAFNAASVSTINAQFGSSGVAVNMTVAELNIVGTGDPLNAFDVSKQGSTTTTADAEVSNSITPTVNGVILVGVYTDTSGTAPTVTIGSTGWGPEENNPGTSSRTAAIQEEFLVQATAAAVQAKWTSSAAGHNYQAAIAAFLLNPSSAPVLPASLIVNMSRRPRPFAPGLAR